VRSTPAGGNRFFFVTEPALSGCLIDLRALVGRRPGRVIDLLVLVVDVALDRASVARRGFGSPFPPVGAIVPGSFSGAVPDPDRCRARLRLGRGIFIRIADEGPGEALGDQLTVHIDPARLATGDD